MKSLNQIIEELKKDIRRAEYVESEYADSVDVENLRTAVEYLEDKLEDRELVKLPCRVGDTVYHIGYGYCPPNFMKELTVKPMVITEISWKHDRSGKDLGFALIANGTRYKFSSIGKIVFLTKEAAEIQRKQLQEKNK